MAAMTNPPGPPGLPGPYSSDQPQPPPVIAPVKDPRVNPVVLILLGIALVVGAPAAFFILRSSGDDKKVGSAGFPVGWTTHTVSVEGFKLGLPPEWNRVEAGTVDESLDAVRKDNPELAQVIESQLSGSLSTFVKFFAFDTRSPTLAEEFATNANVVVESLPAGVEFDEYLQANLSQLREVPKVSVSLEDDNLALPGGRAALIRSTFSLNSPDGEREVSVTQYVFLKGGRGFILSMTTTPGHAATYEPLWEQIAKTFEPL
jgi:hypothetical protein